VVFRRLLVHAHTSVVCCLEQDATRTYRTFIRMTCACNNLDMGHHPLVEEQLSTQLLILLASSYSSDFDGSCLVSSAAFGIPGDLLQKYLEKVCSHVAISACPPCSNTLHKDFIMHMDR
jgi:hypothetical protein